MRTLRPWFTLHHLYARRAPSSTTEVEAILTPTTVSSLAAARAALEQLEVADKANSRPSETVDLDEDVVARNTLAETNIARSTSRASNDSNRISIASQEDFKF